MKGLTEDKDPFTSGIQFSAYSGGSGEARPTYKPARAAAAAASRPAAAAASPENRFMYGLDRNGNPQFMDEAAVSMLLQNPQAKKVKKNVLEKMPLSHKWNKLKWPTFFLVSYSALTSPSTEMQRKSHLCIPRKGFARPQSRFPHSSVCKRFIYSHGRSTYFPGAE